MARQARLDEANRVREAKMLETDRFLQAASRAQEEAAHARRSRSDISAGEQRERIIQISAPIEGIVSRGQRDHLSARAKVLAARH